MFGRKKGHPRAKRPRKSTADQRRTGSNVPTDRKLRPVPGSSRRTGCLPPSPPALGPRGQGGAAAAGAAGAIALDPGDHGAHRRQLDLVVAGVQSLIGLGQHRPAMGTGRRLGNDELIGLLGQGSATARPAQAALARPRALGLLRPVRLVSPGGRQAGVARCLRRLVQPRLQFRYPRRQALHLRPQRPDQSVLLDLGERAEIRRRRHPALKPPPPQAVNGADFRPIPRSSYPGDEQLLAESPVSKIVSRLFSTSIWTLEASGSAWSKICCVRTRCLPGVPI